MSQDNASQHGHLPSTFPPSPSNSSNLRPSSALPSRLRNGCRPPDTRAGYGQGPREPAEASERVCFDIEMTVPKRKFGRPRSPDSIQMRVRIRDSGAV
jgi:hypothetical protein